MKRLAFLFFTLASFCACTKLDSVGASEKIPSGLPGWYAQQVATAADFKLATEAIQSFELYTVKSSGETKIITREDYFDKEGKFNKGYFNNKNEYEIDVQGQVQFLNFIDENTYVIHWGSLYSAAGSGAKGKTVLYRIDAGPVFGEMVYCASSQGTYYTCVKDGNKILTTSGDFYTLSGTRLIQDGTSSPFEKFNPDYMHGQNDWGKGQDTYATVCATVNGWADVVEKDINIGYIKTKDLLFIPVITASSGLPGNTQYGWELGQEAFSKEKLFTQSELPATVSYSALSWSPDDLATTIIFDKQMQDLWEKYQRGTLTSEERQLFDALITYEVQARTKAINAAKGCIRFFAEVEGKRYYVKAILWSKKNGFKEYDNTKNSLSKPNVTAGGGSENGLRAIDLGLSVKWADANLGASSPEGYGDYYAWGELEPKSVFDWTTYKWCNGSKGTLTKYNTQSSFGAVDNKKVLDSQDDVAHVKLGGKWRMPTVTEFVELIEQCTWTWITQEGGGMGCKFTSKKNGKSIFLPAAGRGHNYSVGGTEKSCDYWSSSLDTDHPYDARSMFCTSKNDVSMEYYFDRTYGFPIRPVCE